LGPETAAHTGHNNANVAANANKYFMLRLVKKVIGSRQ
jgi:hypothetical protein